MNTATANPCLVTAGSGRTQTSELWFGPRAFSIGFALLLIIVFWDVLTGTRTFFFRDYGIFGYPIAHYHKECFWRGELPLWNPLNCCGIPFLAQWNTLILYPGSLIYLLLPLPWSLSLFCLVHLFLAGLGMYWLARHWTESALAAAVAGIGFALSGLLLNSLMWPNNIAAFGLMPWVVLLVEKALRTGGRSLLLAALVAALQVLAGAPEILIFTWSIVLALAVGHLWFEKALCRTLLLRLAAISLFVAGLTAVQLLPFLDLLAHSHRSQNFTGAHWALPGTGLINFLLPLFGFYQSGSGVCFQPGQAWTSSYYPGAGVVLLALVALPIARQWRVLLLAILAVAGAIIAMGESGFLYPLLYDWFPPLRMMRFPVKFIILPLFALPLLAAYTVRSLTDKPARRWLIATTAVCIAIIAGAVCFAHARPPSRLPWMDLLQNGCGRVACLLLIATVACLAWQRRSVALQGVLLAGLALDALTHAPWQNPTVIPAAYEAGLLKQQLSSLPTLGNSRALVPKPTHDGVYSHMLVDTFSDYCGRRLSLFGNCNLLDRVPVPDGFYSMYLPEQRLIWGTVFVPEKPPASLADFLGIQSVATNLFEWEQRPSALPLATIGQRPFFAADIPSRLVSADFDPRRMVYLPMEAKGKVAATNTVVAKILRAEWQNQRGELMVEAEAPTLLVLSQSYYHPWRAYVSGAETRIWRANHAFQAIEVPSGTSRVEFVYEDKAFRAGGCVSAISILAWIAAWWRTRRRSDISCRGSNAA